MTPPSQRRRSGRQRRDYRASSALSIVEFLLAKSSCPVLPFNQARRCSRLFFVHENCSKILQAWCSILECLASWQTVLSSLFRLAVHQTLPEAYLRYWPNVHHCYATFEILGDWSNQWFMMELDRGIWYTPDGQFARQPGIWRCRLTIEITDITRGAIESWDLGFHT